MLSCPHCRAEVPEGAKICRSCGRIIEGGGVQHAVLDVTETAPSGGRPKPDAGRPPASGPRPSGGSGAPRCDVCDKKPAMIQQVERNSPIAPAVMGFVALLLLIMALAWQGWFMKLVLVAIAGGIGYAGYRILTAERRYWLCPKCGDTIEIETAA